jgi:hemoglobin-like flavoprotein/uncharacterized protein YjbI with pentapeptide repeats
LVDTSNRKIALIKEAQIDLIEASFEHVKRSKTEFSASFYRRLFALYPQLQPLFAHTSMLTQGTKLYAALVLLVENLRHPAELERVLLPLGRKHRGYGATPEHYPMISLALLTTLEEHLADAWTEELDRAWTQTLATVSRTMLRGAGMEPPGERPGKDIAQGDRSRPIVELSGNVSSVADIVDFSFAQSKSDTVAFTDACYDELFLRNPQLKPLFADVDKKKQGEKLYAALVLMVKNLKHPVELERVLLPLGNRHREYGATAEHYPMVCRAILHALEQSLGDDWTEQVADAWSSTFDDVQEIMLRGAGQGSAPEMSDRGRDAGSGSLAPAQEGRTIAARIDSPSLFGAMLQRFADWFYGASLSTIIILWALIGTTLVSLSFVFPAIRGVAVFANPLSLLLALFLFIRETPERKKQFHYNAWSTIDRAAHVKTSNARFLALQDLCADGVSLRGLPLDGADLSGIELKGADLSSAGLSESNLTAAILSGADLNNVDLRKAALSGAQLSGANLGFADMTDSNCSSADMSHANLLFADLSNANLSGVNLTGAKLIGAKFEGTYLSGANLSGTDLRLEDLEGAYTVGATLPDGTLCH